LYGGGQLAPLRLQYKGFSGWQAGETYKQTITNQEEYWVKTLAGEIPVLELPTDYPRPLAQSFEGNTISVGIGADDTAALRSLATGQDVTLYMLLLAIFNIFLAKLGGQEDIIVGAPLAGRQDSDLQDIIGMFINTLVLRNYPKGEKSVITFLEEVKENTLAAFENQDYPFEDLLEKLDVKRDASRNPLFDVMFILQNMEAAELEIPGLTLKPYDYESKVSKFDLTVQAFEARDQLLFSFEYCTRLFKEETIRRFIGIFEKVLKAVIEEPGKKIHRLEIMSEREKRQVLYDFNDTLTGYPFNKTIHELFVRQAEKTPDRIAVTGPHQSHEISITYRELSDKSDRLAGVLKERGVQAGDVIAIMGERSVETITGILAILKAGGAYLPIEPDYPQERVDYMLTDSSARLLLTKEDIAISHHPVPGMIPLPGGVPEGRGGSLAYIIYTSGTTGKPRGVMVEHGNVVRLVKNTDYIDFDEPHRLLQTGALAFDASTFEIWGMLLNGSLLCLADKEEIINPQSLRQGLAKYDIGTMWMTSSLFNQMLDTDIEIFAGLSHLLVGGEALSLAHIAKLRQRYPALRVINGYGPTENTTFSTTYPIDKEHSGSIPIGKPIANSTAYIVDRWGQPVPVGIVGELIVGGSGVARGYLNNPELTAEKFLPDLYGAYRAHRTYNSKKIYKTGDLARWLPDGNIEFIGRVDHQVKIRGFRIELGEIESRLLTHPGINEAVVTALEDNQGSHRCLCAYFAAGAEVTAARLRGHLGEHLPDYMIPSYFVQMEKIPLTANGKVDRKALPEPERGRDTGTAYEPPRSEIEKKLAVIWAEILEIPSDIGIDDNFFELGGHSLKATILTSRIYKTFEVNIPLQEVFRSPTIRTLAKHIETSGKETFQAIEPCEDREYYPVSSVQRRLFFLQHVDPGNLSYNIPQFLVLSGDCHLEKMETVFLGLIRRHESLRTSFLLVGEEPVQRIHRAGDIEFSIRRHELPASAGDTVDEDAVKPVTENFVRPHDLSRPSLMRVEFIVLDPRRMIFMMDTHHIISDGTSQAVFIKEFMALYNGEELPPMRIQYRDFSRWFNSDGHQQRIARQEKYWLQRFSGEIPLLNLPIDFERPASQTFEGSAEGFRLDAERTRALKSLARQEEATFFMILLAIYTVTLCRLTGQQDIVVGTSLAGRRHPDQERLIGMFINALALRNYPAGHKTFREFLGEVKQNTLEDFENQDYQFENLVEKTMQQRVPGRNPLFDVMMVLNNEGAPEIEIPGLKLEQYPHEIKSAQMDLKLRMMEAGEHLLCFFEYSTALFKKQTVEMFIDNFKEVLSMVIEDPGVRIREIGINHGLLSSKVDTAQMNFEF
jgi:amino acid adenylation domain-containing protein